LCPWPRKKFAGQWDSRMKAISHSIKYSELAINHAASGLFYFLGYIPQNGYKNPHFTLIHIVYLSRLKLTRNRAANSANFFFYSASFDQYVIPLKVIIFIILLEVRQWHVQNSGGTKKALIEKSPNIRFSLRPATSLLPMSCKLYQSPLYTFQYTFLHIQQYV